MTSAMNAQLKVQYGGFIDPHPDEDTIAKFASFGSAQKIGRSYNFPVYLGLPGGVKWNDDHTAFDVPTAIAPVVEEATLAGSEFLALDNVAYADLFATGNGTGDGNNGAAFMTAGDYKVLGLMKTGQMCREIALMYGPGSTSTAAANIGVINDVESGANFAAPQVVSITEASWIPGLWPNMTNHLVDMYETGGSVVVESGLTVQASVESQNRLQLYKAASAADADAGDILLLASAIDVSMYGLEAIANNSGSLFGISAATYPQWRCLSYSAGDAALERFDVLAVGARLAPRGVKTGGTLFVSNPTFTDLSEEANELLQITPGSNDVVKQGATKLSYATACGVIDVQSYNYMKQGEALFLPKGEVKRVGSTDLTFRDPMSKDDWFLQQSSSTAGLQMRIYFDQAVIIEQPWHAAIITGIVNAGSTEPS